MKMSSVLMGANEGRPGKRCTHTVVDAISDASDRLARHTASVCRDACLQRMCVNSMAQAHGLSLQARVPGANVCE